MDMTPRPCGRVSAMYRTVTRLILGAVVATLVGLLPATAQTSQSNSSPSSSNGQSPTAPSKATSKRPAASTNIIDKRSFFFPDLAHSGQPLSSSEKFRLAAFKSVSLGAFVGSAFGAGIGQAADSPAGYGQGASGYGQRFGASMAKNATSNLVGTYFLSSVLHDDPRFFVMGDRSLKQSIKYALRRIVVIRKDDGTEAFNWPGVVAPLVAAGVANTYLPEAQRTVGYTFENYGWSIATAAGVNLLKEYWPTITRRVLVPIGMSRDSNKP
jgi:hypothetical protein